MDRIFVELPGQLEPFETPFEKPGPPHRPCQFIYLTNRGTERFSGLLPIEYDWKALGWGLADFFPMGYTNLLRLEKRYAAHPDLFSGAPFKRDTRHLPRVYLPKDIRERRTEGALFYVLREPTRPQSPQDVIGAMFVERRAMEMADRYARTYGRRAAVGLLLKDLTWH